MMNESPRIAPFRAFRFNPERVDLMKVVQPIYDVIDMKQQQRYYAHQRTNILDFLLSLSQSDRNEPKAFENVYKFYQRSKKDRILIEEQPSFYNYEQSFIDPVNGETLKRRAILASVEIDDLIYPHEKTFEAPILSRMQILNDFPVQVDPVLGIVQGGDFSDFEMESDRPLIETEVEPGFVHKIWKSSSDSATGISLQNAKILIADGHHRFEAVRRLGQKRILMVLVNESDPGLKLYSTHRLVRKLPKNFKRPPEWKKVSSMGDLTFCEQGGLYEVSVPRSVLAVRHLREEIFEKRFGYSEAVFEENIAYTEQTQLAIEMSKTSDFEAAFLLKPLSMGEIWSMAMKSEMLPQKATYFFPKPHSGLLFME